MGTSYVRQSSFADGDTITAALFNDEFNRLLTAFSYAATGTTGHRHDGTAGEGGNIHTIGDQDFLNKVVIDTSNNRIGFFVEVSSSAVEQIRVQDGAIVPVTDNDIDLGTSSLEFKDLFLDGTATVDALVADTADINGGTIDGATVGATSASTGSFTTLGASGAVTFSSTLSVQGNTTLGNAASDTVTVTADIASDLIPSADSTHSLGDSSNYWSNAYIDAITTTGNVSVGGNLTVTGTTTFNGGTLTLGDAADDNVVFGADVNSNIIPNTDNAYDLGSSSQEWKDLYLDGTAYLDSISLNGTAITATAAELNILDGVTSTAAELNILDGVTSTAAELNILDGVTSTAAELNLLDGSTAGTVVNSKAVVYGSSGEVKGTTFQTATNTSGNLLIANGTGFASTAVGDLSEISTVANDDVLIAIDTSGGGLKRITRSSLVSGLATSSGISNVVEDTTPQLGGDLDVNSNALVSTSNGNIALTPNGTGVVRLDGNVDVQSGEIVLKNSGSVSNVKFYCEVSNAHYTQLQSAAHSDYSGNVVVTLPTSTDTLVGRATTDTLTNKTLTSPDINTPDIDGGTIDNTVIGGSTAAAASVTTLSVSSTFTLGGTAITATAAELNILDGVTATATELNILDGVTATTAELNILDGVTATATELNILDGVTSSTSELNILDGVTATATELNILDGVTSTTAELNLVDGSSAGTIVNSKAVIYGSSGEVNATTLQIAGTAITSTAAELNILDGVTATATELNILDGVTSTTAELNILDGVTSTAAELNLLDGVTATTAELNILDGVTSTAAELNILDGVTSTAAELNLLDGVTATTAEINYLDGVTSNIQTQLNNVSVTNGTLTKTFIAGETATITLTSNVLVPNVSVTKEVAQTGSTNNDWLVNSSAENYTRYNSAAATTLNFNGFDLTTASHISASDFSVGSEETNPFAIAFSPDGTNMYIAGYASGRVKQYSLSTAFDISTASYASKDFFVASQEDYPKGVAFNTDGTKMFITGSGASTKSVFVYTLTTGFDVSTASYSSVSYDVSSQTDSPSDIVFNSDGTFMYLLNRSTAKVNQYTLTTGFDVSTASYTRNFSLTSQETAAEGLRFNNDGTKMFVVGEVGDDVNEYSLSTAFDISTASYVRVFSVSSQDNDPKGLAFSASGDTLYIVGEQNNKVYAYSMTLTLGLGSGSFASADVGKVIEANSGKFLLTSTGGAFTTLTTPSNFNQVASGSWQMYGLQFNSTDGDLELAGNVVADFTAATKLDDFDIGNSEGTPAGITFNPTGTVMLISGDGQNKIFQYNLTTGFDLTTASYASKSYDASARDSAPRGLRFNDDGTKLFWIGESNKRVYIQTLSTAYDLGSVGNGSYYSIPSSQTTDPTGLEFSTDGTIMYIVGRDNDECYQYTLSTAFDPTTASYANKKVDLSSGIGGLDPYGLFINSDGTKLYHCGEAQWKVFEFEMTTPFDVSTASYTGNNKNINPDSTELRGVYFTSDTVGKMYVLGRGNDYVVEYSILSATYPTTGYHAAHTNLSTDSTYWTDINSMTASESAGSGNIYYCVSTDDRTTWKVAKGTDGERNIAKNNSGTWQYNSNATHGSETWTNATVNAELYAIQEAVAYSNTVTTTSGADDLASVSLTSSFSVSSQTTGPEAIQFNSTGTVMLVGDTQSSSVKEYHLSTGFDVSTASYDSQFAPGLGRIDGIAFNPDGTKMYLVSYSNASIHQYTLSTGFDVSTAGSAVGTYNVSSVQTNLRGLQINNNGTKIYTISDDDDQIEEFTLSTAYDVTTASHESSTSIGTQSGNAQGFCFNGDGTILFVCDENDGGGTVYQYTLSTAYDTSTLSYASKSYVTGNAIAGVFVTSDGTKMFGAMNGDNTIKEYALQTTTSTTTFPNQMNKTQLDAIPDANHFTLSNDLDLAIIMNQSSGATSLPSSDGVAINYDAAVLNQGAIHGTDYTFDAPAQNKVRITSVNAANLKVRVV